MLNVIYCIRHFHIYLAIIPSVKDKKAKPSKTKALKPDHIPTDTAKVQLKKVVHVCKESSPVAEAPKEKAASPEPIDTSEVSVPEHGKPTALEQYEPKPFDQQPKTGIQTAGVDNEETGLKAKQRKKKPTKAIKKSDEKAQEVEMNKRPESDDEVEISPTITEDEGTHHIHLHMYIHVVDTCTSFIWTSNTVGSYEMRI